MAQIFSVVSWRCTVYDLRVPPVTKLKKKKKQQRGSFVHLPTSSPEGRLTQPHVSQLVHLRWLITIGKTMHTIYRLQVFQKRLKTSLQFLAPFLTES